MLGGGRSSPANRPSATLIGAKTMNSNLPADAEQLLAVSPEAFVEQRKLLVRRLRDEGRAEDAQAIARMKKPPPVVLALNRAARDRPQAAKDAADAAKRLGPAQLSGDVDGYRRVLGEMEQASALLAEVAVANLSKGKRASDPIRRRLADLIRGALAAEDTRQQLIRGVLDEEVEAQGLRRIPGTPDACAVTEARAIGAVQELRKEASGKRGVGSGDRGDDASAQGCGEARSRCDARAGDACQDTCVLKRSARSLELVLLSGVPHGAVHAVSQAIPSLSRSRSPGVRLPGRGARRVLLLRRTG